MYYDSKNNIKNLYHSKIPTTTKNIRSNKIKKVNKIKIKTETTN